MGIMVLCPPFLYQIQDGYRAYIFLSIKLQTISYTALIDDLVFCDIDENRVKDLAGEDIRYTTDYRELLTDNTIDAVDIVTPSKTHMAIGSEFLKNGKDVFVEKPMTMSSKEAEEFIRIAEESGRVLMVGHIFRYHPGINEIKNKINKKNWEIYYMIPKEQPLVHHAVTWAFFTRLVFMR